MVITQGLTFDNYENVISDVWKTMYSSKKPVANTHRSHFDIDESGTVLDISRHIYFEL